jgi:hypothetical protein
MGSAANSGDLHWEILGKGWETARNPRKMMGNCQKPWKNDGKRQKPY